MLVINPILRLMRSYRTALVAMVLVAPMATQAAIAVQTTNVGHGVSAWYTTNDTVPVVELLISFEGAGYASDPDGKAGRAAFAAAMLGEGAGEMTSEAMRAAFEEKAISFTATTDADRLQIRIYCLREHAARAGELLALAMTQPTLAESDQQRIKAQIRSLLARLEESPAERAERLLLTRAFSGHPYANAPYGTPSALDSLQAQDIRDYLTTHVTRGNVLITAAGDVDADLLDAMLEPLIDGLQANDSGAVGVTRTDMQGAGETVRETMAVPQTAIAFAAPAIARDDPRFYAQFLLNHIVGGHALFSRLGDQVRRQKGLVYGIDTDLDMKRGAAMMRGALATRNANADLAREEVSAVLARMQKTGVTSEECKDAKSYVIGSLARKLDSNQAVAAMLMAMRIYQLGEDYLEKRSDYFNKVSCGDINALAAELLNPANFLFAVVGGVPEPGGVTPLVAQPPSHHDVK